MCTGFITLNKLINTLKIKKKNKTVTTYHGVYNISKSKIPDYNSTKEEKGENGRTLSLRVLYYT